jgi:protein SPA2
MVIPMKSTMEEEYIEVPYNQRDSSATLDTPGGNPRDRLSGDDSASEYNSPLTPASPPGLGGLSKRLRQQQDEDNRISNRSGDDYYGRSSTTSEKLGRGRDSRAVEEQDKMKRDYEYKLATMQAQLASLQRELSDARELGAQQQGSDSRVHELEDELDTLRRVSHFICYF